MPDPQPAAPSNWERAKAALNQLIDPWNARPGMERLIDWGKQGASWLDDQRERAMRALVGDPAYDAINAAAAPLNQAAAMPGAGSPMGVPATLLGVTDRMLAANRLARYFDNRRPQPLTQLVKQIPGGMTMRAPVVARYEDALELGQGSRQNWDLRPLQPSVGGQSELERYARLGGATSSRTSWGNNVLDQNKVQARILEGRPITPETLLAEERIGMARSKYPNIVNAIEGRPLTAEKGHQMKGESFAQYQLGQPRAPADVHIIDVSGGRGELGIGKLLPEYRQNLERIYGRRVSPGEAYMSFEDAIKDAIGRATGRGYTHDAFQQLWEGARIGKGEPPWLGPMEILDRAGLTAPGALQDPRRIREAIRSGILRASP